MSVRAVGTEFNVRNYPEEGEVRATLVEGQVIASANGGYIEYDYHIDAENGEILKYDFEHDDDHHATPAPGSEYITSEEAIAFALERAGLARNQVTNLKAEFETEHGIALYEVEFDANGYEYEIKVNAADGSILKFDRDYDDDHNHGGHHENPTAAPPPNTPQVKPPARSAPRMAAASMPLAIPETTIPPCWANS